MGNIAIDRVDEMKTILKVDASSPHIKNSLELLSLAQEREHLREGLLTAAAEEVYLSVEPFLQKDKNFFSHTLTRKSMTLVKGGFSAGFIFKNIMPQGSSCMGYTPYIAISGKIQEGVLQEDILKAEANLSRYDRCRLSVLEDALMAIFPHQTDIDVYGWDGIEKPKIKFTRCSGYETGMSIASLAHFFPTIRALTALRKRIDDRKVDELYSARVNAANAAHDHNEKQRKGYQETYQKQLQEGVSELTTGLVLAEQPAA